MATVNEIAKAIITLMEKQEQAKHEAFVKSVKAKETKYPWQIDSIKRKDKVLGCDARLSTPAENEKCGPLETSGFSRFVFTILNRENGSMQSATANIPVRDVPYMVMTTNIAMEKIISGVHAAPTTENSTTTGIAYTQKLFDKNFKGQTPAGVLMKDPSQRERLLSVKAWLTENVDKYPANKVQIAAIDEAVRLFDEGKLSANTSNATMPTDSISIYKSGPKFKTKQNEKGYNLIYEMNVICDTERKYPFRIEVMNAFAPVESLEGGQKNINLRAAVDVKKFDIVVSAEEWFALISKMNETKTYFEQSNFMHQMEQAIIAGQY